MPKIKIEMIIPQHLKDEPIIYDICRQFKVVPNIIEASFSTDMGWAILTLEGESSEIDRLLGYLRKKNISVNTRL